MSDAQDNHQATAVERSRREFQEFLDETFPIGAMCAVITLGGGHMDATTQIATGRLLCSDVEHDGSGRSWYQLTIDSSGSINEGTRVQRLWVTTPRQHGGSGALWESDVRTDEATKCILRLNADPPEQWRPTSEMREAVTQAYAAHWPATEECR
jgi:hypothetical protein